MRLTKRKKRRGSKEAECIPPKTCSEAAIHLEANAVGRDRRREREGEGAEKPNAFRREDYQEPTTMG
jgi:hypothetical protein